MPFNYVKANHPRRSYLNLTHEKKFTTDMGILTPCCLMDVIPGDSFKISANTLIRFNPLVSPVMHEINVYTHYFFVPYRLLWDEWETFITRGKSGDETPVLPRWTSPNTNVATIWDYFGFPVGINPTGMDRPVAFPRWSYYFIFNEYYRDETLQAEQSWDSDFIQYRNWEKDYFTSALPFQERGTPLAIPLTGTSRAEFPTSSFFEYRNQPDTYTNISVDNAPKAPDQARIGIYEPDAGLSAEAHLNLEYMFNNNSVDLTNMGIYGVNDLRLSFQIQKWMERNARSGARYTEFLLAHFGVHNDDLRLDRPAYIGGTKAPVIISEVLQTSKTVSDPDPQPSPQGNLAGHGLSITDGYVGRYNVKEYGLIMGILSVMPRTGYFQGINRQWLRQTNYDYFHPEFVNLSEQDIMNMEIYATDDETQNLDMFGYQGMYDEYRYMPNTVSGFMKTTFKHWHLAQEYSDLPILGGTFIKCQPSKRIYASSDEQGLIVQHANIIQALRPLPAIANPGLIDH